MIRSVIVRNLRGISEGQIDGLAPLTVLVGPNNSGKSTVLDAILIGAGADPISSVKTARNRRQMHGAQDGWLVRRDRGQWASEAVVTVASDAKRSQSTTLTFSSRDPTIGLQALRFDVTSRSRDSRDAMRLSLLDDVPGVFLVDPSAGTAPPLHKLLTEVTERGLRDEAMGIVKEVVPELRDISILAPEDKPLVYLVYPDGAIPVGAAGDGIRLLLQQSLELAAPGGGVVLMEEPESHLHPAAIRQSARAIWAAVRRKIQVVITTHSLDLIDSLLECAKDGELDKLAVYRIQLNQGQLTSVRLAGSEVAVARTQIESDLR